MAIVSLRSYARHRGVALAAVQKAIASGRICTRPDGLIDQEIADRQWEDTTRCVPSTNGQGVRITNNGPGSGGAEYARARAEREHYSALLAKLEYEERAGKLIDTDDVKAQAFRTYREFRDRLLNIPDRVSELKPFLGRMLRPPRRSAWLR
jgi:hypothetical protein